MSLPPTKGTLPRPHRLPSCGASHFHGFRSGDGVYRRGLIIPGASAGG